MSRDPEYFKRYYAEVIKPKRQATARVVEYGACYYCGLEKRLTRDHVIAKANGGTDDEANIVGACSWCNNSKGKRSLEEWRLSIAKRLVGWPSLGPTQLKWLNLHGFDAEAIAIEKLREVKFAFEGGNTLARWSSRARHRRESNADG